MSQVLRRQFLILAGALVAAPFALAQRPKPRRIGWLLSIKRADAAPFIDAFVAGMREHGYVHGESFVLELRYADGDARRFPELARELAALGVDVVLAVETPARAMVTVSSAVPIVLTTSIDPVAAGLVKSLARPGTNVTGLVDQFDQVIAKHVELLVELVPRASRIAYIDDPFWSARDSYEKFARAAAGAKGLNLTVASVGDANAVQQAFATLEARRPDGLIVAATGGTYAMRDAIIAGARRLRLPAVYGLPPFVESGGLISYGPNLLENNREAADFVVRILKGAKPSELPVRQSKKYYVMLNLRAAREIGIDIPPAVLLRADRVIE